MFRILSLDGGGIKGVFAASVLATLEDTLNRPVANHFDLIVGTSTGGIIAIGLGLGYPARSILDFYRSKGAQIFPNTSIEERAGGWFRQLFGPKHSRHDLKSALAGVFGQRLFGDSKSRLVIPAYDAVSGRIFLFKTAHQPLFVHDIGAQAVDVALATSAAPTFFSAARVSKHEGGSYMDGGVWANCPAMIGILEAHHFLKVPLENISVLSIGTTAEPSSVADYVRAGIAQWRSRFIALMFQAQMELALTQARMLIGDRLVRINHLSGTGQFSLDDAREEKISQLVALGRAEATKASVLASVRDVFMNGVPVAPFHPFVAASNVTAPSGMRTAS